MSETTLRMPRLGETMEAGEIGRWLVAPGQRFARGEALIEVETDKTVVEYPALGAGTLVEQLVAPGERVTVGDPIARVDVGDGPDWTLEDDGTGGGARADGVETTTPDTPDTSDTPDGGRSGTSPDGHDGRVAGPRRATPVARRLARGAGIDLSAVRGSGRRGRVERGDVERLLAGAGVPDLARAGAADVDGGAGGTRLHASGIAYVVAGPADGTPFLLLHGFAGDHTAYAATLHALARHGCRVLAPDLPGHGATRLEAERPEELVAGLEALRRDVLGERALHVVAHSLGALPALALAGAEVGAGEGAGAKAGDRADASDVDTDTDVSAGASGEARAGADGSDVDVDTDVDTDAGAGADAEAGARAGADGSGSGTRSIASLTLIAPAGIGLEIDATFVRGIADPASPGEVSHLLGRLSERPSPLSGAAIGTLHRTLARGRLRALAASLLGTSGQAIDVRSELERVARALPVRVLVGHRDRIVAWQDACALSSAVAVHHFRGAGHMPHWDEPREVLALLLRVAGKR